MKTAWERVEIARNPNRKTSLDYVESIFDEFVELHGDRISKDDSAIVCGLAKIGNQNFTVIAGQKGRNTKENIMRNFGMPNPESYRKAIRFIKQAEKFSRPIITFVDTKGAYPGIEAEEKGQGEAIAKSMFEMAKLKVPIITIVIGEGSSGGALAISIANKNNFKIIDKIIEEKEEFEIVAKNMSQEILKLVNELNTMSKTEIIQHRYSKFRQIGDYKESN